MVEVSGLPVFPTSGHLNMTTVAVADRLTLFSSLGYWASGARQVVPRDRVFPPGRTDASGRAGQRRPVRRVRGQRRGGRADPAGRADPGRGRGAGGGLARRPAPSRSATSWSRCPVDRCPPRSAVAEALAGTAPGQSVTITYRRGGQQRDADVVLGSSPDRQQGLLGVRPGVEPQTGDIRISLGDIGGPSAGLMFALAVVDKLTPGELTGGRFVAGTGTINSGRRGRPDRRHPVQDAGRPGRRSHRVPGSGGQLRRGRGQRPGRLGRCCAWARWATRWPVSRQSGRTARRPSAEAPTGTPHGGRRVEGSGRAVGPAAGSSVSLVSAGTRSPSCRTDTGAWRTIPETMERALWPCGPRWEHRR